MHLAPLAGRGRIASKDAMRVRGTLHESSKRREPLTRRALRVGLSPQGRGEATERPIAQTKSSSIPAIYQHALTFPKELL